MTTRVLVLGASGMLGHKLVEVLSATGVKLATLATYDHVIRQVASDVMTGKGIGDNGNP